MCLFFLVDLVWLIVVLRAALSCVGDIMAVFGANVRQFLSMILVFGGLNGGFKVMSFMAEIAMVTLKTTKSSSVRFFFTELSGFLIMQAC